MLTILNPVLDLIHFIFNAAHYALVISFLVGKGMYFCLERICNGFVILFQAIVVILDELWLFVMELHTNLNDMFTYIETSTNKGLSCVLEGFFLFASEMRQFFTNGKLHSKLLASAAGRWVTNLCDVISGALLLIADTVWFLLTIIPRTLLNLFIVMGDWVVLGVGGTWKLALRFSQNVVDELFRYTIAVAVIFLLLSKRKSIYRASRRGTIQIVRISLKWIVRIYRFLFVLRPPREVPQRNRVQQRASINNTTSILNKSNESNCCVVCRDRPKCVLLLPCKHLCMCEECADFITGMRHPFCPLCRSTVHKQLSVYV